MRIRVRRCAMACLAQVGSRSCLERSADMQRSPATRAHSSAAALPATNRSVRRGTSAGRTESSARRSTASSPVANIAKAHGPRAKSDPRPRGGAGRAKSAKRVDQLVEALARLQALLGATAVAAYRLDQEATELSVVEAVGFSPFEWAIPPRALRHATADLEALCGHAVVVETAAARRRWPLPIRASAGICVPISSRSEVLGTLWCVVATPRKFNDLEVLAIERTGVAIAKLLTARGRG